MRRQRRWRPVVKPWIDDDRFLPRPSVAVTVQPLSIVTSPQLDIGRCDAVEFGRPVANGIAI